MIFTRYKGVKIALQKSGTYAAIYHGRQYYTPTLAGMVKVLSCEIR